MRTKLRDGETVVFETQKHWIVLAKPMLLLLVSIVLSVYLKTYQGDTLGTISKLIITPMKTYSIYFVPIFLAVFLYAYIERKYNIWVVTNYRVIDEEGVFSAYMKESLLDKINNVTYYQSVYGGLMGYGNVAIQTAAEQGQTSFVDVADPKTLCESISNTQSQVGSNRPVYESAKQEAKEDTMDCPYCAEAIKPQAKICRFCSKDIISTPVTQETSWKHVKSDRKPQSTGFYKDSVLPEVDTQLTDPTQDLKKGVAPESSGDIRDHYNPRDFLKNQ